MTLVEARALGVEANRARLRAADASWVTPNVCIAACGGCSMTVDYEIERAFRGRRVSQDASVTTNHVIACRAEREPGLLRSC